jgi:hypothetical protein
MRSHSVKATLFFVLALTLRLEAQTNPHTQIRWPANCNTANMVYTDSANTCIAALAGPQISPATQISWPASCSGSGNLVYNFATNSCIANGTAANPAGSNLQVQYNNGGVFGAYTSSALFGYTIPGGSISGSGDIILPNKVAAISTIQANGQTLGGKALGVHFNGDSITFGNGASSTWTGFAQPSLAYAIRLGQAFGGIYTNDAKGGNQVLDQAIYMSQGLVPQLSGPTNSFMINTNDAYYYMGNANLQTVTKRIDTFTHNYIAIPQGSEVAAQSCTQTGTWTADNGFGSGNATFSTTNGNTLSCSVTPPAGSPGVVLACYIIADANSTSTFTLAIDGTNQADPFASGTTWHGNGDGGALIATAAGAAAGPVCARFSGLTTGAAHTFLWTVTGTTGASAKVEPLMLLNVPAPNVNNPNAIIFGFPIPSSAAQSFPYYPAYYTITQTIAQQAATDGLNVTWIDTEAAEANNIAITLPVASATATVTPGGSGWVSDNTNVATGTSAVSFYRTGAPLVPVASAPACGQYSVSSGTYTINSCDFGKPLTYSFVMNCGAGISNATYVSRCLADTLHPNNAHHAVILSIATAALANLHVLFPGAPIDLTNSPAAPQPQTPKDWWSPNQLQVMNATAWNPGIAWLKQYGTVWATDFTPTWGTTNVAPAGLPHSAWCTYPGSSIPKDQTTLTCAVQVNNGGLLAGYVSSGHVGLNVNAVGSVLIGIGGTGTVTHFVQDVFTPVTAAVSGTNQNSPPLGFSAFTWNGSASATDTYLWKNTVVNTSQNTALTLTHTINSCLPGPCTWNLDISGATGVNKLGTVSTSPASNINGSTIQAQQVSIGGLMNFVQNSASMAGTGWACGTATCTAGQADPYGGTTAVSIQSASSSAAYNNIPTVQNLVSATTYTACGYIKGAAGGEGVQVFIGALGSGQLSGVTTAWQFFSFSAAPTTSLPKTLGFAATTATSQTVYVDAWSVTPGTSCAAYLPTSGPVTTAVQTVSTPAVSIASLQTVVNCATSGTATFSMPLQGATDKRVVVHLAACVGNASYTYPTAFTNIPGIFPSTTLAPSMPGLVPSNTTTAVTISGSTSTGTILFEDF